jgi:FtsP/CotA-like multicopper oxidase with cupredoxin domain/azurin
MTIDREYTLAEQRRDGWLVGAVAVACLALIAAVIGVGFGARAIDESKKTVDASGSGAASAPQSAMVHLNEFAIDPDPVTVAAGGFLTVMNAGTTEHNLAIKGSKLATPNIAAGGSETLKLDGLAKGTYTMFCAIPGHEAAGMKTTLKVVDRGGALAASATASPEPEHKMSADEMDASMNKSISAFPAKTAGVGGQVLAPKVLGDGTKQFMLTSSVVNWEVAPGKTVKAWTYNGTVPGPTMHVDPGDKVQIVLKNELPESTAIHFHGIDTPNAMDGVPGITQDPIKSGATYTYSFTAQSTPAVGMYHSHQDAVKQVPNGLAGAFLIGEEPVPSGVTVSQETTMMLNDSGTVGLSLNGKSFPATAPVVAKLGDWIEVHYMNEGVMVHPMHLHGMAQRVIAKDGYALPAPYDADTILVGPGERYTVLVHATVAGTWAWHCHILSHAEDATGMFGMVTALVVK